MMESFVVIWLNLNTNELNDSVCQLRRCILCPVHIFTDLDQCVDFLSEIHNEKVFFIVSDSLGQTVVPLIHETRQIDRIYLLHDDITHQEQHWINQWRKIQGLFADISSILDVLRHDLWQREQNSGPISIIPKTIDIDLNELDSSFMYSQLLKEMLLEINFDKRAKTQFIHFCHDQYADHDTTLQAVNDFERDYDLHSPIWWCTKEPFIYSVLNRSLRLQDIETILRMGFFIRDLDQQIARLHSETNPTTNVILYRGQGMSNEESEKMKRSEGGLLAFNNFLSTSYDDRVSLAFAASSVEDPDLTGIFFRIEIDPSIASAPFASLDKISYYSDSEKEILFSMHTVFRIGQMKQTQDRLWQVQLLLTSDNDEQLKHLTDHVHHETRGQVGHYRLGTLMMKMGQLEKAELFLKTLIETTSDSNWELLAHIYHQLGSVYFSQGNASTALIYFDKTLHLKENFLPSTHLDFATTYNNIALTNETIGNHSVALSYFEKTLEIQQKSLPATHSDLSTTYNNLGMVHRSLGNTSIALSFFQKSLEIQQKSLPPIHPDLASTYSNIGVMHQFMGNYPTALSFFVKTLEIQQKSLPPTHPHLSIAYSNAGMMYDSMGDYPAALACYQKALDITEKVLPPTHPDLAVIYSNVATAYYAMDKHSIALEYFKKALEIQEKVLPLTHPSLAITYNNIGGVYDSIKEPSIALSYYLKTLEIEEKSLPPLDPSLAITYNNIGMAYDAMKDYTTALFYYQKTVEIQEKIFPSTHPTLVTVYNNIGAVSYRLKDHLTAINFYRKALDITEKSLTFNHPDLVSVYGNIGASYRAIGDQPSAIVYFEKASKILEKTPHVNYLLLATIYYNMAQTFDDSHQYQKAIEHISHAIQVIHRVEEPNCPKKQKYQDYLNELQQKL